MLASEARDIAECANGGKPFVRVMKAIEEAARTGHFSLEWTQAALSRDDVLRLEESGFRVTLTRNITTIGWR